MRRRPFLASAAVLTAAWPRAARAAGNGTSAAHLAAAVDAEPAPFPGGTRPPFGWPAFAVRGEGGDDPPRLTFPAPPAGRPATALRFAAALDYRNRATVAVRSAADGAALGAAEVRFTQPFQPFSVPLSPAAAKVAAGDGVILSLDRGRGPLFLLAAGGGVPPALAPHLLLPGTDGPWAEFFRRFGSRASLQPFGWMEGCVLDGLLDLAENTGRPEMRATAADHLALFAPAGQLDYEDSRGRPVRGRASGIESTLPFAAAARLDPDTPLSGIAFRFWEERADAAGVVADGGAGPGGLRNLTAEGSYTVGYPMAVIARARGDERLADRALTQIRVRQAALFDGTEYHRVRSAGGGKSDRGWARGVAWHLLGAARTLSVLRDRTDLGELIDGFRALADWAVARQLPAGAADGGLWSVFLHEPALAPDTSGSAGIAAALAIGVNRGWLGDRHAAAADRTRAALTGFLTPDGFLGGASQANKGGRGLQASNYRVVYQMGMGLAAQLIAARDAA